MTFEREVSVWGASRIFEDFVVRQIPWVKAFYSVERHRVHGGHLHALFAECGELEWRPGARGRMLVGSINGVDVWDQWKRRYGRNSIEMPRRSDATARNLECEFADPRKLTEEVFGVEKPWIG